jgi:ribosomal protein L21
MSESPMFIGGAFGREVTEGVIKTGEKQIEVAIGSQIVAEVLFYRHDEDVVQRVLIKGVTGEIEITEPTDDQRSQVSSMIAAKVFKDSGIDMHDFKQIVEWALCHGTVAVNFNDNELEKADGIRLVKALDQIFTMLGGFE